MPAHSEMTDLTVAEYEALLPSTLPNGLKREAWFNEGGWNQLHRFNRHIKKLNPNAKTMLSLGGWDNEFTQAIGLIAREANGCDTSVPNRTSFPWIADSYPDMVSDRDRIQVVDCDSNPVAPNRTDFIQGLWMMSCKYGFDGVDIDWEYPAKTGWVGSLNSSSWIGSPLDREALTTLMQETRAFFDQTPCPHVMDDDDTSATWMEVKPVQVTLSTGNVWFQSSPFAKGRKMIVSSATSPAVERVKAGYDAKKLGLEEEYIGIMSYDFHGAWDTVTSPQAPLYNKERKTTGAPLTDKIVQQVPCGPFGIDNFTIIRGNEVWNDPFDKKAGQPYPHRNVGVPHQKIYTGFSTYGRGWSLKQPITAQNDPAFKYGTPSLCHDPTLASLACGEKSTFPLPACCPGCNGNGARDVTKERGISTLYDLEESQAGLWNADTAFRKFDEGTVTAYAASGDQFIRYATTVARGLVCTSVVCTGVYWCVTWCVLVCTVYAVLLTLPMLMLTLMPMPIPILIHVPLILPIPILIHVLLILLNSTPTSLTSMQHQCNITATSMQHQCNQLRHLGNFGHESGLDAGRLVEGDVQNARQRSVRGRDHLVHRHRRLQQRDASPLGDCLLFGKQLLPQQNTHVPMPVLENVGQKQFARCPCQH